MTAGQPRDNNDPCCVDYRCTKKSFSRRLRKLSKQYENEEVVRAIKDAKINRNFFWNIVQKSRKSLGSKSLAIKRPDGVIVHQVDDVLEVWKNHFSSLGIPKRSESFDEEHFRNMSNFVNFYNNSQTDDDDIFMVNPFTFEEVQHGIKTLNKWKAAGFDEITSEHLAFGGECIVDALCLLFNIIREIEYIPICFRWGVQVPLFLRKDLPNLLTDHKRGITLLSTYNKL